MTAAGVNVSAIADLANCGDTFTSATLLPACLVEVLSPPPSDEAAALAADAGAAGGVVPITAVVGGDAPIVLEDVTAEGEEVVAATGGPAGCPVTPGAPRDFARVAAACAADRGDALCAECTCALIDAFEDAFAREGLLIDPVDPSAYPAQRAADLTVACTTAFLPE